MAVRHLTAVPREPPEFVFSLTQTNGPVGNYPRALSRRSGVKATDGCLEGLLSLSLGQGVAGRGRPNVSRCELNPL